VKGQQMEGPPAQTNHEGNLFHPVDRGDPGAHGMFDDMAHEHSVQSWGSRHRAALAAATAVAGGVGVMRALGSR